MLSYRFYVDLNEEARIAFFPEAHSCFFDQKMKRLLNGMQASKDFILLVVQVHFFKTVCM